VQAMEIGIGSIEFLWSGDDVFDWRFMVDWWVLDVDEVVMNVVDNMFTVLSLSDFGCLVWMKGNFLCKKQSTNGPKMGVCYVYPMRPAKWT
jgi:hypothetical protein